MEQTKYLVVGSSHAALEALTAIRMHDAEGSLTLLTRDPHLPYSPTVLPYVVSGRSAPTMSSCATRTSLPSRRSVSSAARP
jgi:phenylglyoxylate dehydrogenase epsilon subunit